MLSTTTFIVVLFVLLAAVPSVRVSALPSHGRDTLHHRAIAVRRPIARSVTRCRAKSSASAHSASASSIHATASATVEATFVETTTKISSKKTASPHSASSSSAHATASVTDEAALIETTTQTTSKKTAAAHTTTSRTTATSTPLTTTKPQTTTKTTTTDASTTTSSSSSSSSSYYSGENTGEATYYATGLGACGITDSDSTSYIAAMSVAMFDNYPGYDGANPNNNPLCNKKVKATYNGKSVTVSITDRCTGCSTTDLDFSPLAFVELAELSVGRLTGMTWEWVS